MFCPDWNHAAVYQHNEAIIRTVGEVIILERIVETAFNPFILFLPDIVFS